MRLPNYAVRLILVLLYFAAVTARFSSAERGDYLYFKGVSAANYRYAYMIGKTGSLPSTDRKAAWPDGLSPAEVKPMGVEYFTGYLYRLTEYFSELEEREFARRLTALFFSLSVFSIYALAYGIWRCQAGALFSAFLVALFHPLQEATNGRTYLHLHFAVVLLSIHILLVLRYRRSPSIVSALPAALAAFALLATWEVSLYYLLVFAFLYVLWPGVHSEEKVRLIAPHAAILLLAAFLLPHFRAQRLAFSFPAVFFYIASIYLLLVRRVVIRGPAVLHILLASIIVSLLLKPFHTSGVAPFPVAEYLLYRIRYSFAKPVVPQALPEAVRYAWMDDHAPPSRYALFNFFFPLVLFVPALLSAVFASRRAALHEPTSSGPKRREIHSMPILPVAAATVAIAACLLLDRSVLPVASLSIVLLLALSFWGFREHLPIRTPFIGLGTAVILLQSLFPGGGIDIADRIARGAGLTPLNTGEFIWVSIGNADKELVRFLVRRTSVRNPCLAPPEASSLLATFAGRTTLLVPGVESSGMIEKTTTLLGKYYASEEHLYEACQANGVSYVLYSIDCTLDDTRYSLRYLAGEEKLKPSSAAFKMHFFPETLKHFALVYENDTYRLFQVTEEFRPIFTTDHPPVYQHEILERNSDDLESFYRRVVRLMLTCSRAYEEQEKGNHLTALNLFNTCLHQAPHFTAARLGKARSLSRLNELEAAKQSYLFVVKYAPDNPEALYGMALTMARLGETREAQEFIDVLLSATGNEEIIRKARLLKRFIEEGIPIDDRTEADSTLGAEAPQK